ncbi:MAG TPA: YfcE family phosphodiesterase [Anaerolineales bacterium]|nr:YfcE family phosphodiesterase [Anaerolineales bacterium]
MITLGVLADTHIPDRAAELPPKVLLCFKEAQVGAILHAGDVSVPRVLKQLEQIAPVYAVQGNRDIYALSRLPLQMRLNFEGVSIGLAHGHGTFSSYMVDKFHRQLHGRLVERYIQRMLLTFPEMDVIVFGHLHVACNFRLDGKLLFNPGSTSYPWPRMSPPTFGLLKLAQGMEPHGEIIELQNNKTGG